MSRDDPEHPECECQANDYWACIGGTVYGPCDAGNCSGVCVSDGRCGCPLHTSSTHEPAYGSHPYSE